MKKPKICPANLHQWTGIKWKQVQTMSAGMYVRVTGVVVDAECSVCPAIVLNGRIVPEPKREGTDEPKKKSESVRHAKDN